MYAEATSQPVSLSFLLSSPPSPVCDWAEIAHRRSQRDYHCVIQSTDGLAYSPTMAAIAYICRKGSKKLINSPGTYCNAGSRQKLKMKSPSL